MVIGLFIFIWIVLVFIEVEFKLKSIKRLFREKLVGDEDGKGIKIYIYIF